MKKVVVIGALVAAFCVSPSWAIGGIGAQWGVDFGLNMDDQIGEQARFDSLKLSTGTNMFNGIANLPGTITGMEIPVYIDRTDWKRTVLNLGGKVYIDCIPFIDAIELSTNFGLWEYSGQIRYPKSIAAKLNADWTTANSLSDVATITYDTLKLTGDVLGTGLYGLSGTPYAKLHFDLSLRKYLVQLPKRLKILKIYAGAGASLHFATPAISAQLIEDAIGSNPFSGVKTDLTQMGTDIFGNEDIMKKVLTEIGSQLMTPHWGMHILAGTMIKIPVIPVGIYVDGKYQILFDKLDEGADISGNGFLINAGIALAF